MSQAEEILETMGGKSEEEDELIDESFTIGRAIQDIEDGLSHLSKGMKKTAPNAAKELADIKKQFRKVLKSADKEAEKSLESEISAFKGQMFQVPFLGDAKLVTVKASGTQYFVEFEKTPSIKFNISHRDSGDSGVFDSRLEITDKDHPNYPGGYGPHGKHKFPDFKGLMKKIAKMRT